uniref:Secreted protein n=1 Tax=Usnea subgracilis TaxID=2250278 RepID=A0A482G6Q6_9LECA|nr:hypothetical protein [Usnea subgracilis]
MYYYYLKRGIHRLLLALLACRPWWSTHSIRDYHASLYECPLTTKRIYPPSFGGGLHIFRLPILVSTSSETTRGIAVALWDACIIPSSQTLERSIASLLVPMLNEVSCIVYHPSGKHYKGGGRILTYYCRRRIKEGRGPSHANNGARGNYLSTSPTTTTTRKGYICTTNPSCFARRSAKQATYRLTTNPSSIQHIGLLAYLKGYHGTLAIH